MPGKDPYPPLITPRSPSFERARQEQAHPSPAANPEVVATVARLFELEEEARRAYVAAAQVAKDDAALAQRLQASAEAHQQRREALGQRILALGGAPPRPEDCRPLLQHGLRSVADARSSHAALEQLRALEQEVRAAYEQARGDLQRADSGLELDAPPVLAT